MLWVFSSDELNYSEPYESELVLAKIEIKSERGLRNICCLSIIH